MFVEFLRPVVDVSPNVFFVDKDHAEINVVRDVFPETSVKLCVFHASTAERPLSENKTRVLRP